MYYDSESIVTLFPANQNMLGAYPSVGGYGVGVPWKEGRFVRVFRPDDARLNLATQSVDSEPYGLRAAVPGSSVTGVIVTATPSGSSLVYNSDDFASDFIRVKISGTVAVELAAPVNSRDLLMADQYGRAVLATDARAVVAMALTSGKTGSLVQAILLPGAVGVDTTELGPAVSSALNWIGIANSWGSTDFSGLLTLYSGIAKSGVAAVTPPSSVAAGTTIATVTFKQPRTTPPAVRLVGLADPSGSTVWGGNFYASNITTTKFDVINGSAFAPPQVAAISLASPTLSATGSSTGGTLAAGTYYYVVTVLTPSNTSSAIGGLEENHQSSEVQVTLTGTTSSVSLSWSAFNGAVAYKVYRGTAPGAENTLVAWVRAPATTASDIGQSMGSTSPSLAVVSAGVPGPPMSIKFETYGT